MCESGLRTISTSQTIREIPSNPLKSTFAAILRPELSEVVR